MAEWFVRPSLAFNSYGNGSGTSYDNAFSGYWLIDTFTADPSTDRLTLSTGYFWWGHPVYVWSTGTLPAPLNPNVQYFYVQGSGANGRLATNKEGTNIVDITDTGTGTHYISFGINWNAINAGDTLYVLDDLLSVTNISNTTSVYRISQFKIWKDGVTIKGKYPKRPDGKVIFGNRWMVWRDTGINDVLWTDVTTSETFVISKGTDGTIFLNDEVREYYPTMLTEAVASTNVYPATDEIAVTAGWAVGDRLQIITSGTLPGGLSNTTIYFIRTLSGGRIQLSLTPGGSVVDITSTGSGTHTLRRMFDDATLNDFNVGRFYTSNYHAYYRPERPISTSMSYYGSSIEPVLELNNRSNITIEDLTVYGVIKIINCTNITLNGLTLKSNRRAIDVRDQCQNITIKNCTIDNCGDGIYYSGSGTQLIDSIIENNTITNTTANGVGSAAQDCHAIGIQGVQNVVVRNNYVKNAVTAVTWYVGNESQYPGVVQSMIVYNNYASDIYSFGTGFADRRSSSTTLVCPSVNFVTKFGVGAGTKVRNRTTGAIGTVTGVTTTVNTNDTLLIDSLSGGSRNYWQRGDVWQVQKYDNAGPNHGVAYDFHGEIDRHTCYFDCYNNIAYNVDGAGVKIVGSIYPDWGGRIRVYNNTCINCVFGMFSVNSQGTTNPLNNIYIRNNIFVLQNNGLAFEPAFWHTMGYAPTVNTDINNNVYYYPADPTLSGNYFRWRHVYGNYNVSLTQHLTAMRTNNPNNETIVVIADPSVVNASGDTPESYKLQTISPCRRAGKTVVYDLVTDDYFGNPRYNETGGFCIGPHERWEGDNVEIGK